jgi:hypothetical protein
MTFFMLVVLVLAGYVVAGTATQTRASALVGFAVGTVVLDTVQVLVLIATNFPLPPMLHGVWDNLKQLLVFRVVELIGCRFDTDQTQMIAEYGFLWYGLPTVLVLAYATFWLLHRTQLQVRAMYSVPGYVYICLPFENRATKVGISKQTHECRRRCIIGLVANCHWLWISLLASAWDWMRCDWDSLALLTRPDITCGGQEWTEFSSQSWVRIAGIGVITVLLYQVAFPRELLKTVKSQVEDEDDKDGVKESCHYDGHQHARNERGETTSEKEGGAKESAERARHERAERAKSFCFLLDTRSLRFIAEPYRHDFKVRWLWIETTFKTAIVLATIAPWGSASGKNLAMLLVVCSYHTAFWVYQPYKTKLFLRTDGALFLTSALRSWLEVGLLVACLVGTGGGEVGWVESMRRVLSDVVEELVLVLLGLWICLCVWLCHSYGPRLLCERRESKRRAVARLDEEARRAETESKHRDSLQGQARRDSLQGQAMYAKAEDERKGDSHKSSTHTEKAGAPSDLEQQIRDKFECFNFMRVPCTHAARHACALRRRNRRLVYTSVVVVLLLGGVCIVSAATFGGRGLLAPCIHRVLIGSILLGVALYLMTGFRSWCSWGEQEGGALTGTLAGSLAPLFDSHERCEDGRFLLGSLLHDEGEFERFAARIGVLRYTTLPILSLTWRGELEEIARIVCPKGLVLGSIDYYLSTSHEVVLQHPIEVSYIFNKLQEASPSVWVESEMGTAPDFWVHQPIYLMACKHLVALCDEAYITQLHSIWSLYLWFALHHSPADAFSRLKLVPIGQMRDTEQIYTRLRHFDLHNAHCANQQHEAQIRKAITAVDGGEAAFNALVQRLGTALSAESKSASRRAVLEATSTFKRESRLSKVHKSCTAYCSLSYGARRRADKAANEEAKEQRKHRQGGPVPVKVRTRKNAVMPSVDYTLRQLGETNGSDGTWNGVREFAAQTACDLAAAVARQAADEVALMAAACRIKNARSRSVLVERRRSMMNAVQDGRALANTEYSDVLSPLIRARALHMARSSAAAAATAAWEMAAAAGEFVQQKEAELAAQQADIDLRDARVARARLGNRALWLQERMWKDQEEEHATKQAEEKQVVEQVYQVESKQRARRATQRQLLEVQPSLRHHLGEAFAVGGELAGGRHGTPKAGRGENIGRGEDGERKRGSSVRGPPAQPAQPALLATIGGRGERGAGAETSQWKLRPVAGPSSALAAAVGMGPPVLLAGRPSGALEGAGVGTAPAGPPNALMDGLVG